MKNSLKPYLQKAAIQNKFLIEENKDLRARVTALEKENTHLSLFNVSRSEVDRHAYTRRST